MLKHLGVMYYYLPDAGVTEHSTMPGGGLYTRAEGPPGVQHQSYITKTEVLKLVEAQNLSQDLF